MVGGASGSWSSSRFNEAAGIHRRKLAVEDLAVFSGMEASMRPPEFTGGNRLQVRLPRAPPYRLQ